ncbi:MAG: ABC transporter permease [Armatimonadetes bacterium]|nr:ABC transporter permease [Armatimonadota bacterium]
MRDLMECAVRELWRRKGRTLANVAGYALAVAMMGVITSLLVFAREATGEVLASTGTHFMAFAPTSAEECAGRLRDPENEGFVVNGAPTRLLAIGLVDQVRGLPAVKQASPYLLFRFQDPASGQTFTVGGFDPSHAAAVGTTCCAPSDVVEGRFLNPDESGGAMAEEAFARARGLHPGTAVEIAGARFPIRGIVNPGVRPAKADLYMALPDAAALIGRRLVAPLRGEVSAVLVEVVSSRRQAEAMDGVKRLLPGAVVSSYACWKPAAKVMGMNEGAAWLLTLVIGACAVVLALKSQLASLIERRRDIGILKAMGWTDGSVVLQILSESLLQAVAGGLLGCLAAFLLLRLAPLKALSGIEAPGTIGVSAVLLGAGFALALLGGVVAGSFPALLAARQRPAEALRRL